MFQLIKLLLLITIFAVLAMLSSCSKNGSSFKDSKALGKNKNTQETGQLYLQRKKTNKPTLGLPSSCTLDQSNDSNVCIQCNINQIQVKRCFPSKRKFIVTKACKYTNKDIKCIDIFNTRVIKIPFINTKEEVFINNTSIIMNTIDRILAEKVETENNETDTFVKIIKFFELQSATLLKEDNIDILTNKFMIQLKEVRPPLSVITYNKIEETFKKGVQSLQEKRVDDKLKPTDGFTLSKLIINQFVTRKYLKELISTLNTEGLTEKQNL